jgi:hypothetical protein
MLPFLRYLLVDNAIDGCPSGAANSPPQRERPRRTRDTWGDQAAATPGYLRLADGVPGTTPDEVSGAVVQLEDPSQPTERGLPVAEQHTEADGGLQAIGAPKGLADRSGDAREAGRQFLAKPRRHVEKGVAKERANGLEAAVEATEKQRVPRERSTAAGLRTGPRELTGGEPSEQQMERAAAAHTQACIGGSGDAAAEPQLGEGGSANAQDELEGLELDIYGLPVIPDLRNGHSMPASPLDVDIMHMDDADTNRFESDVSDEGDKLAAASTVAYREHPPSEQRSEVAQPTHKGQALPDSVEIHTLVESADRSGRVAAKELIAAGGTDRREQMNGSRPVPEQRQTKGRRETAEARGKEGPSKAAAAKAPRKHGRRQLNSSKPSAAQSAQASVEAQPKNSVALLETEPLAPSTVRPRKRAASAVESGSSMAQIETEPALVVHPGRKAASAVERREADSYAAPASREEEVSPPETVLPPRKRAKASMLRGGPALAGVRDAPSNVSQHAAADTAAGKSSAERHEHKAAERPAVMTSSKQPNGSARAARADQGKGQKGAAVDWAAYATDMARLAAEAEALLAEEEDDL